MTDDPHPFLFEEGDDEPLIHMATEREPTFAPPKVHVQIEREEWDKIVAQFEEYGRLLSSMLVSSNMASAGDLLEIETMRELVSEHAEQSRIHATHDTNNALEDLYGAIIALRVGDRNVIFCDPRLMRAAQRARIALNRGGI